MNEREIRSLHKQIRRLPYQTRPRLRARVRRLEKNLKKKSASQTNQAEQELKRLHEKINIELRRLQQKKERLPQITLPQELPITAHQNEIIQAIRQKQILLLSGDTGSGKSTQIPKLCLMAGRGMYGLIGHTQPRRIAARMIAQRVSEELGRDLDEAVGYKVRFSGEVSQQNYIKVMTDGILLAEILHDPLLLRYDTIIIDEAHERSINIDFLLGYLKKILPRRKELKLIITSATLDIEKIKNFFVKAPHIEIPGRNYPVEIFYQSMLLDNPQQERPELIDLPLEEQVLHGVQEAMQIDSGDILVFLPGEKEIRETHHLLQKKINLHTTSILPLYSRLPQKQQQQIFADISGRKIVLATNVAETSLTVPNIQFVIDSGLAKLNRYSTRNRIQRLPVEQISQANAIQRAGRCGRTGPGICLRLYTQKDFEARPAQTDPEIQRINLEAVILQMVFLGLGNIEDFAFIDHPDPRMIREGVKTLQEIQALTQEEKITELGKSIAHMPVDPRMARLVLAGAQTGAAHETMVISAALSIQDPRETPREQLEKARQRHREFYHEESDFVTYLHIWRFYQQRKSELNKNRLRKEMANAFLNYKRMREWEEIYSQLKQLVMGMGFHLNQKEASYETLHQAILTGLVPRVAKWEDKQYYRAPGNTLVQIFPGSTLFKKKPKWIMAAEFLYTTQLYAVQVARIEPEWLENFEHLISSSYFEPYWDSRKGRAIIHQKKLFQGLELDLVRKVAYHQVDLEKAREMFIWEGLVRFRGNFEAGLFFWRFNRDLLQSLRAEEAKKRSRDIVVSEQAMAEFYEQRIPYSVYDIPSLRKWHKGLSREQREQLYFDQEALRRRSAQEDETFLFPDQLQTGDSLYPLKYRFEPGGDKDGVTVQIPLGALKQLSCAPLTWLVPGYLEGKVTALLRSLPKKWRRQWQPLETVAGQFFQEAIHASESEFGYEQMQNISLEQALLRFLAQRYGAAPSLDEFRRDRIEEHFFMRVEVFEGEPTSQGQRLLAASRDLSWLQQKLSAESETAFRREQPLQEYEQVGIRNWDFAFDTWPSVLERDIGGIRYQSFPGLQDQNDSVALRIWPTDIDAHWHHWFGLRRLLALQLANFDSYLRDNIAFDWQYHYQQKAPQADLADRLLLSVVDGYMQERGVIDSREQWQKAVTELKEQASQRLDQSLELIQGIYRGRSQLHQKLQKNRPISGASAVEQNIQAHEQNLLYPDFLYYTSPVWLKHYPRFLDALKQRLDKFEQDPRRYLSLEEMYQNEFRTFVTLLTGKNLDLQTVRAHSLMHEYRWLVEEYLVSLFAQNLKTSQPVSAKRLGKLKDKLADATS